MTTPHPPVDQLRHLVKRHPEDGALLGGGTDAIPFEEEDRLLDIIISQGIADGPFAHGGIEFQSFTVLTKEGQPYAGGIKVEGKRYNKNLFLLDDKGTELACMYEETPEDTLILSSRPFFPGQEFSSITVEKSHGMYEWYKISSDPSCIGSCTVQVASKTGGFVAGYKTQAHISPVSAAEDHTKQGHANVMSVQQVGGACVALIKNSKRVDILHGTSREALVAPGMDPCLVICIVVDHDRKPRKYMQKPRYVTLR
jgi:hypothetical protein